MSNKAALALIAVCIAFCTGMSEARQVTQTLAIIKPDAWDNKAHIEAEMLRAGFKFAARTVMVLDDEAVEQFYAEHTSKPFFADLLLHMSGKPVAVYVLERQSAVGMWRAIMGPTDPENAKHVAPKSIRAKYGSDITRNAVHGSDSIDAAKTEIAYFFPDQAGLEDVEEEGDIYDFDLTDWELTAKDVVWAKEGGYDTQNVSRQSHLKSALNIMDLTEEDLQLLPESARELVMNEMARQRERMAGLGSKAAQDEDEDEYEDLYDTDEPAQATHHEEL